MKLIKDSLIWISAVLLMAPGSALAAGHEQSQKVKEVENHKQLALSIPGLGSATVVVTPANALGKPKAKEAKSPKAVRSITIKVPESVDDAIDYAQSASRQAGRFTSDGLKQASHFASWIGICLKQWSKQFSHSSAFPTATPGGSPYVGETSYGSSNYCPTQLASGQKLYVTREGRLKTVIGR